MQVAVSAGSELVQPEIDEERNATAVCEISPQDIADIPTTQLYTTKAAVMMDKVIKRASCPALQEFDTLRVKLKDRRR